MRRRNAEASKRAIVDATLEILRTRGIHELTTELIAEGAGCAKGLLNYHFGSRDGLLNAAVSKAGQELLTPRVEATRGIGAGVVDRSWGVLQEQVRDGTMVMWAGLQSMSADAQMARTLRAERQDLQRTWHTAIEEWLDRSGFSGRGAAEVARAAWAVIDGFGFALLHEDGEALYPAYLIAWLGLIGELGRA